MRPIGTIVVVGDESIAEVVCSAGWRVQVLDYFWGQAVHPDWVAAVIDISVGGGTGLSVAERFKRKHVTPIVLFHEGDRHRVGRNFAGVERARELHRPEFRTVLALSARASIRARAAAMRRPPTKAIDVGDPMILDTRDR